MKIDTSLSASVLLVIPTRAEWLKFQQQAGTDIAGIRHAICGFGVVAAAARTAQSIAAFAPRHVVLLGIAGTYDSAQLNVGQAACFQSVTIDGIGVGAGDQFKSASAMGFPQVEDDADQHLEEIGDSISLNVPNVDSAVRHLLTCCAASACAVDSADRRRRYPDATAEDMEGYGVALACRISKTPLSIIRGISNEAGDRHKKRWKVDEAIAACWKLSQSFLTEI